MVIAGGDDHCFAVSVGVGAGLWVIAKSQIEEATMMITIAIPVNWMPSNFNPVSFPFLFLLADEFLGDIVLSPYKVIAILSENGA
jgi:hypothetical protein